MYTTTTNNTMLFCDYYKQWITVYKEGAIRPVTMSKYNMAHQWLEKLIPNLTIGELDRFSYQKLLNDYAMSHERQTTMDFHHHLKCAILDGPYNSSVVCGKSPFCSYLFSSNIGVPVNPNQIELLKNFSISLFV